MEIVTERSNRSSFASAATGFLFFASDLRVGRFRNEFEASRLVHSNQQEKNH